MRWRCRLAISRMSESIGVGVVPRKAVSSCHLSPCGFMFVEVWHVCAHCRVVPLIVNRPIWASEQAFEQITAQMKLRRQWYHRHGRPLGGHQVWSHKAGGALPHARRHSAHLPRATGAELAEGRAGGGRAACRRRQGGHVPAAVSTTASSRPWLTSRRLESRHCICLRSPLLRPTIFPVASDTPL